MKLSQQLSGTATFTDANGSTTTGFTRKENSVPLPLPVIGVRAAWAFAPQWVLEGQGQVFKADIDGYDGRESPTCAAVVTWMFSRELRRRRRLQPVSSRRSRPARRDSTDACAWPTRASSCT